jgi:hypothetical protein
MPTSLKPIYRGDILMGREVANPITPDQESNLIHLIQVANDLQREIGKQLTVSSGYRPAAINAQIGGAKTSAHMSCQAVDFHDPDGYIDAWIFSRRHYILDNLKICHEHPDYTKGWAHIQTRPIRGTYKTFIP